MCGLDVDRGWCGAAFVDWLGNVVDSRRVSRDELLSFLSRMDVSLVATMSIPYIGPVIG